MCRRVFLSTKHLDRASALVIGLTFILFFAALLVKGFTHDLFLEGGVLLVSVKLILNTYQVDAHVVMLDGRIGELMSRLEKMAGER